MLLSTAEPDSAAGDGDDGDFALVFPALRGAAVDVSNVPMFGIGGDGGGGGVEEFVEIVVDGDGAEDLRAHSDVI